MNQAVRKARRFSLDVVTFLVESQPLSLTKCSDNGRIPLHSTARDQSSSIDLIHYLVNRNPATISIKSQMGNTSLHLACENKLELDKVRLFIDKHDTILRETNNNGFTPLHMACNYDAPFNVIQYLVEKWPGAAKVIDNTGRTPMALYCKKDHRTIETIQLLLCANPSAIETKDARDQLPLELRQWAELICNSTFADYRYGPASKRPRIVTGWLLQYQQPTSTVGCCWSIKYNKYEWLYLMASGTPAHGTQNPFLEPPLPQNWLV